LAHENKSSKGGFYTFVWFKQANFRLLNQSPNFFLGQVSKENLQSWVNMLAVDEQRFEPSFFELGVAAQNIDDAV
jgi:hypothetical protein